MDEQKNQPRNPNDLLVFQNIDTEDHEWQYDAIKSPLPYYIKAGEVRELPYYIAKHGINKLIDKILLKKREIHTNPVLRSQLLDQIVLGLKHINHIREKTPNEIMLEEMQRKKDTDPFEELLKKRDIEAERIRQQAAAANVPQAPLMQTIGTPVTQTPPSGLTPNNPTQPVVNNVPVNNNPVASTVPNSQSVQPGPEATDPVRQNVYNLLRTKLHMDLSHQQTKEKLDSLPTTQLVNEFKDQLPELVNPQAALVPDDKATLSQEGMPDLSKQPVQTVAPSVPSTPTISMSPQAPAAPLLDQQLGQVG